MEKSTFRKKLMEYLAGELDEAEKLKFEKFLEDHPEYQAEFEEMFETWEGMDQIPVPEPSERMDVRFYEMLFQESSKEQARSKGSRWGLSSVMDFLWRPQLAYGLLLLVIGLGVGYFVNPGQTMAPRAVTVLDSETEAIRQQLVLTLLEQPSANKRLQGVNEVNKIPKADEKVINALLQTLNNDANVNVRLAAIEALVNYVGNPRVREGLVQSIVHQESPIVQVTLADLMVALQEKKSIESFKTLLRTKELNGSVKQKLEQSIKQII